MKATKLFDLAVKERLYFLFVVPFNDWERGFACLVVVFGRIWLRGQVSISCAESCYVLVQNSKDQRAAGNDMSLPHANNLTICIQRMQKQFKKCRPFLLAINSRLHLEAA